MVGEQGGIPPVVAVTLLIGLALLSVAGIYYWGGGFVTEQATPSNPTVISARPQGDGRIMVINAGPNDIESGLMSTDCDVCCEYPIVEGGMQPCMVYNCEASEGTLGIYGPGTSTALLDIGLVEPGENLAFLNAYGGGSTEWARGARQTSDGGYVMGGFTQSYGAGSKDFLAVKTDPEGEVEWAYAYGGGNSDEAYAIDDTDDGGYILAGTTMTYGAGSFDVFVVKIDSAGGLEWAAAYGGLNPDYAWAVEQTSDGGYIVGGNTDSFGAGGSDLLVIKLDSNGNVDWAKAYGGISAEQGGSIMETSGGGYILAGCTSTYGAGGMDVLVVELTALGVVNWAKSYGGANSDIGHAIRQTAGGEYVAAGETESYGGADIDILVMDLDAAGNVDWARAYGSAANTDRPTAHQHLEQTSDGGYIVAGTTSGYGAGSRDAFLLKLTAAGAMSWANAYGNTGLEQGEAMGLTSDGGYFLSGRADSYTATDEAFLTELDDVGELADCGEITDIPAMGIAAAMAVPSWSNVPPIGSAAAMAAPSWAGVTGKADASALTVTAPCEYAC